MSRYTMQYTGMRDESAILDVRGFNAVAVTTDHMVTTKPAFAFARLTLLATNSDFISPKTVYQCLS
jgi:hypothetical protein